MSIYPIYSYDLNLVDLFALKSCTHDLNHHFSIWLLNYAKIFNLMGRNSLTCYNSPILDGTEEHERWKLLFKEAHVLWKYLSQIGIVVKTQIKIASDGRRISDDVVEINLKFNDCLTNHLNHINQIVNDLYELIESDECRVYI